MAKLLHYPAMAIVNGFKGTLDFYFWKGIACVRSWPRSPGKRRAPAVEAQWAAFSYITKLWKSIDPDLQKAYVAMATETNLRPIDVFVRGYLSGTLRFYTPPDQLP